MDEIRKSWQAAVLTGFGAFVFGLCVIPCPAATIRTKADLRLWETVRDRAAPLAWPWAENADSATLTFSNRVTRATSTVEVARETVGADHRAARGSVGALGDRALPGGETLVDVTLVQKAGANEVARESATLAYVAGAGGGPITVRSAARRDWDHYSEPRVFAVDPAWQGLEGDSGYDIAWPDHRGLVLILK